MNLLFTVIGGKYKFQVQDSFFEYFYFGDWEIWKTHRIFWKKATFSRFPFLLWLDDSVRGKPVNHPPQIFEGLKARSYPSKFPGLLLAPHPLEFLDLPAALSQKAQLKTVNVSHAYRRWPKKPFLLYFTTCFAQWCVLLTFLFSLWFYILNSKFWTRDSLE